MTAQGPALAQRSLAPPATAHRCLRTQSIQLFALSLIACQDESSSFAIRPSTTNAESPGSSVEEEIPSDDFETKWCRIDRVESSSSITTCEWVENTSTCVNGSEVMTKTYNDYGEALDVDFSSMSWASGTNTYDCQDFSGTGVWCHLSATDFGEGDSHVTTDCEMEDLVSYCTRMDPDGEESSFTIEHHEYGIERRWLSEERGYDAEATYDCSGFPYALSKRRCKMLTYVDIIDDVKVSDLQCDWDGQVQTCEDYDYYDDSTTTTITHYNNQGYATKTYEYGVLQRQISYTNCD